MKPSDLDLALTFIQSHPRAAAREFETQPITVALDLLLAMPLSCGKLLMMHMLPAYAAQICLELPSDKVVGLLSDAHIHQICAVVRCMNKNQRTKLLRNFPEKSATLCRLLLNYSEDTVGAWMNTSALVLPEDCSAGDALKRLSQQDSFTDCNVIAVVDLSQHLLGFVDARVLLKANSGTIIKALIRMTSSRQLILTLSSRASLIAAAEHDGWKLYDVLPVLDRNHKLVGFLRHVDLRNGLERFSENTEVMQSNDLISTMGEAYVGSMSALLSLVISPKKHVPLGGIDD